MKKLILLFGLFVGITFFASAQTTPKIKANQINQNARITHGVLNGELTRREAKVLRTQQKHIRIQKKIAKADGVVTKQERAAIKQDQRIANRSIRRQQHDAQSRF